MNAFKDILETLTSVLVLLGWLDSLSVGKEWLVAAWSKICLHLQNGAVDL